jgi:hypothetical protein
MGGDDAILSGEEALLGSGDFAHGFAPLTVKKLPTWKWW